MCWSANNDVIHYISSSEGNIDTTSPIAPGQAVLLRKGENEFTVLVVAAEGNTFKGTVKRIGPVASIEVDGISRGQSVAFNQMHVFRVYRDMEATQ